MSESLILRNTMLKIGALPHVRIFRNNTGMGWQGKGGRRNDGSVLLENARPIHAGLIKGGSDLIGLTSVIITPAMVGKRVAIFTAIETKKQKAKGADDNQQNFINAVRAAGGIAGEVRDENEALALINAGI